MYSFRKFLLHQLVLEELLNEYFVKNTGAEATRALEGSHEEGVAKKEITKSTPIHNGYVLHEHKPRWKGQHFVTVTKDNKQVGALVANYNKQAKSHAIEAISVTKDHRHKGVGSAMYEHLLQKHGHFISDSYISKDAEEYYKRQHARGRVTFHDESTHEVVKSPKTKHGIYMKVHK